ncbi:MAG: hypothetical protein AB7E13_11315 [Arcobacteraceae bacterium]
MALSNLRTNWKYGSYIGDRNYLVQIKENEKLYDAYNNNSSNPTAYIQHLDAHNDGTSKLIAIGYGYDFSRSHAPRGNA